MARVGTRFRLLTAHYVIRSLAMSLAGGFVGAYLLRLGFSLAAAVAIYAGLYLARFVIRFATALIVRRIGVRRALLVGATLGALQFLPLIHADRPIWLIAWIITVCIGECIYFPVYHAASAVCGGDGQRGRQIASRLFGGTTVSVIGPLAGGALLADAGAIAGFGLASVICLASVLPLLRLGEVDVGPLPSIRQAARVVDRTGITVLVADGWMSASMSIAWSMILFASLDCSFGSLGAANCLAAVVGALVGLVCGRGIDQGKSEQILHFVVAGLLAGVALRASAAWIVAMAPVANAVGAAVGGIYATLLTSVVYDRAKQTGEAYQFYLCSEAGLDIGTVFGCLVTAGLIWAEVRPPLAVLPAAFGAVVVFWCLHADGRPWHGATVRADGFELVPQAA